MKPMLRRLLLSFLILAAVRPAFAETPSPRRIGIIAAVSPAFKENNDWRKEIITRVGYANKIFEKTFGLYFVVEEYKPWDPGADTLGMPVLVEGLRVFSPASPDKIVIGFHKMTHPQDSEKMEDMETVGTARYFQGQIAIRDPYGPWTQAQGQTVLVHEIAHLFGAVHVGGASDIMRPTLPDNPSEHLDPENRQIVQQTRGVDFQKGLDSLPDETIDNLISIYERLIRANPQSDFYHQLGLFYRKRNLESRAVAVWEEALRQNYANPLIHYELGVHYQREGNYDRAVQELGAAIAHYVLDSQKKQKANTLNLLGAAYFGKDMVDQAVFTWMKGLVEDPDNAQLQSNLAAAFLKKGDLDRAMTELEKLQAKNPGDPVVLSNLGTLSMEKKQFAQAADYFSQALEKNAGRGEDKEHTEMLSPIPEWELRLDRGSAYAEMKDDLRAAPELERAKGMKPDNADIRRELGKVYIHRKEYKKAMNELEEAVKLQPKDAGTRALLAQAYAESGNQVQALAAAREAIRWSDDKKDQALLYRNIGLIYAKDNDTIKAMEALKMSVSLNWNDADAHYNLGVAYARQQDWANARRSFETALRLKPDFQQAKDALAQLDRQKA